MHYDESNFLEIQLKDKMLENGTYDIFTKVEAELFDGLDGFYVSQYTAKAKAEEEEDEDQER